MTRLQISPDQGLILFRNINTHYSRRELRRLLSSEGRLMTEPDRPIIGEVQAQFRLKELFIGGV